MLSDLLNLLRGRCAGPDGFLILAAMGEPLARDELALRKSLDLETPMAGPSNGFRSRGGDGSKHSSRDGVVMVEKLLAPVLNLKGGNAAGSRVFNDTVLVE